MNIEVINNLNDGINVKSDPSAISEGGLVDCVGFDLTKDGIIETAGGLAANDISSYLPVGVTIQCFHKFYIGTTLYVLATSPDGLYVNGVLKDSAFTGRFKGVSLLNNIYVCNGVYARRFDGTTCYQWGITAPTTMPTISAGEYLSKAIDNFEVLTDWTANQVSCTVAAEAVIKKEGTQSAKFTVAASTIGYSYRNIEIDGTKFTGGSESTVKDYLRFWLYVDNLTNLDELAIFVDIGNRTFTTDYFSYSIVSPGASAILQALGLGKTADVMSEETVGSTYSESVTPDVSRDLGFPAGPSVVTQNYTTILSKTITKTVVDPVVADQVLSFWRRSNLFQLKSATWKEVRIPKSLFIQTGDATLDWSTITAIKIQITASAQGAVNVYIDDMKFIGGSDLVGDYWFMYTWGRTDSDGNVLHESSPSRNNTTKQYNITGPITFDRHPFSYTSRPLSTDSQVNCGVMYGIGGGLIDFWTIGVIEDNTTTSGVLFDVGDSFALRKLVSKGNEPAPPGTDVVLFRNKVWMVGDPSYPTVVRSSDILADGTLAPEGWPTRNGYELAENHGELYNINILNKLIVVKGKFGEWSLRVNDPVDYLQVNADRVSDKGLLAQDGVITLESTHIYPSSKGFVQSDGASAAFVLSEIEPLIDANIGSAIGASSGLLNYFTYNTAVYGNRTAKVDLYRGKPRFTNLNNILFSWLSFDPVGSKVYVLLDGSVYLLDSGQVNTATVDNELYAYLKSRIYRPGKKVGWTRMNFDYDTGGAWFRLEIYIDSVFVKSIPFRSTTRTQGNFRFGPSSGYDFQFVITGNYKALAKIHFPMRIYHSG